MFDSPERIPLPAVLIADDGGDPSHPLPGLDAGLLLRETNLGALMRQASSPGAVLALDMDSVAGLDGDDAAVEFVTRRLGIKIVLSRRPQVAARVAELGHLGMLHVLALDSTGLGRALDSHPRRPGVGTVVSPGLVLPHLRPAELASLPPPILAYGLISAPDEAWAILALADGVVVRPAVAAAMAAVRGAPSTRAGGGTSRLVGTP